MHKYVRTYAQRLKHLRINSLLRAQYTPRRSVHKQQFGLKVVKEAQIATRSMLCCGTEAVLLTQSAPKISQLQGEFIAKYLLEISKYIICNTHLIFPMNK
jgi:hypothetical protein